LPEERTFSHLVVIGSSAGGIEALSRLVSTLPEGFQAPIVVAQHLDPDEMAKVALDSTRNLSAELRRSEAEDNLTRALRDLLEVAVPPGIQARLSVEGDESLVPGHVRGQLFLILREAVRNAVTHSGCIRIKVGLEIIPDKVVGSVEDDGRGFDAQGTGSASVGLRSMKERTALLGGEFRLAPEPGVGTKVVAFIPLARER
jgi:signal transduction histidine kinase